jgi:hypothetical protein
MLNFSDMSLMGREDATNNCSEATSDRAVRMPPSTQPPPTQMISAAASALISSITG